MESVEQLVAYVIHGPASLPLILVGLALNLLTLAAFGCRPSGRSAGGGSRPVRRIQLYLSALAVWDAMVLLGALLLYCLPTVLFGENMIWGLYTTVYPAAYALANDAVVGTVWTLLALSLDRYLACCRPLLHRRLASRRSVGQLLLCIVAAVILFGMPRFFELQVVEHNGTLLIQQSEMSFSPTYQVLYRIVACQGFVSFVLILQLCITAVICRRLRSATRKRSYMTQLDCSAAAAGHRQTQQMTETLPRRGSRLENYGNLLFISLSVKFALCHSWMVGLDVAELFVIDRELFLSDEFRVFVSAGNLFVLLNSCGSNFLLYLWLSGSFRRRVKQLFRRVFLGSTRRSSAASESQPFATQTAVQVQLMQNQRRLTRSSNCSETTRLLVKRTYFISNRQSKTFDL